MWKDGQKDKQSGEKIFIAMTLSIALGAGYITIAATQQTAWEIKNGPAVFNSTEQNGIQVSISSGL